MEEEKPERKVSMDCGQEQREEERQLWSESQWTNKGKLRGKLSPSDALKD